MDQHNNLKHVKVAAASGSTATADKIAGALAKAVEEGGSTQFKLLVDQLKKQPGINDLNANSLSGALGQAQQQIADLVQKEFGVKVDNPNQNISATTVGGGVNTVTVTINKQSPSGGTYEGSSVVKGSEGPVTIKVKGTAISTTDIGNRIAQRLAKAARKATKGSYNPGLELLKAEFGLRSATVTGGGTTVTVTAKAGSDKNKHDSTLIVAGASQQFNDLVSALAQQVSSQLPSGQDLNANKLKEALNVENVKNAIKDLLSAEFGVTVEASQITVTKDPSKAEVTVTINKTGSGTPGAEKEATAKVTVTKNSHTANVIFKVQVAEEQNKNQQITNLNYFFPKQISLLFHNIQLKIL